MKREFETFLVWGREAARSDKTSRSGPVGLCFGDVSDEGVVYVRVVRRLAAGFGIDVEVRWALFSSVKYTKTILSACSASHLPLMIVRAELLSQRKELFHRGGCTPKPGRGEIVPIQYPELLDNVR